ncbi:YqaJ viral recombinase family protein [Marisediminicola sp. LYQ85]|uniref:YqaJ viral recombinase family protein n=1 Tax=Marisediminicola sp. LYQ85 TaxID=3391062 RepID=UPI003982D810
MTFVQPMLSLWDEPEPTPRRHLDRIVADSTNRFAWLKARAMGVTATDVARLSSTKAADAVALEKIVGSRFGGNAYTDHGRVREPEIARWARGVYGMEPSTALFHAEGNRTHLATPDGIRSKGTALELCEIKTTMSVWRSIPRSYLRQVWWQQYVLGAERTLVVWEQHADFVPLHAEPQCRWVDRDDNEIHVLIGLADRVLELMSRA